MHDYTNEQLQAADPSIFTAQNGKLKTAVKVLESLSETEENEFDSELLDAAKRKIEADYL